MSRCLSFFFSQPAEKCTEYTFLARLQIVMKRKLGTASFQCFLHCNCTDKGGQRNINNSRIIEWLVDSAGLQASSEQSLPCCQRVYRQLADKSDLKITLATIEDIFASVITRVVNEDEYSTAQLRR